jgi:hypothetical protein
VDGDHRVGYFSPVGLVVRFPSDGELLRPAEPWRSREAIHWSIVHKRKCHEFSRLSSSRAQRTEAVIRPDGFCVLNASLGPSEMEEIKGFVDTAMRLPHDSTGMRPHNTLIPLRWNDAIVQRMLLSERRLGRLRDVTLGDDLRWISGYISGKEEFSPPLWAFKTGGVGIIPSASPRAAPHERSRATVALPNLLPMFEGERRSLRLNRNAPAKCKVAGAVAGTGR